MSVIDIAILGLVVALAGLAIFWQRRKKKAHGGCAGGCSGCSAANGCPSRMEDGNAGGQVP